MSGRSHRSAPSPSSDSRSQQPASAATVDNSVAAEQVADGEDSSWLGSVAGGVLGGIVAGPLGAAAGAALGHWLASDDEQSGAAPGADTSGLENEGNAAKEAALAIGAGYTNERAEYGTGLLNLNTEADRRAALDGFTQNAMGPQWDEMCASTSLLATVMMGSGSSGVAALATSMQGQFEDEADVEELRMIAEAAADGEVSEADMLTLNQMMHRRMQAIDEENDNEGSGVSGAAIEAFGNGNPAINAAMEEGRIGLRQIDNTGDGQSNHWVVDMGVGTDDEAVYDPFQRRDGHQVITDSEQIQRYQQADPNDYSGD